jgi:hypothetical protein
LQLLAAANRQQQPISGGLFNILCACHPEETADCAVTPAAHPNTQPVAAVLPLLHGQLLADLLAMKHNIT